MGINNSKGNKQKLSKETRSRVASLVLTLISLLVILVIMTFYLFRDNGLIDSIVGDITDQAGVVKNQDFNNQDNIVKPVYNSNEKIDSSLKYIILDREYIGHDYEELNVKELSMEYSLSGSDNDSLLEGKYSAYIAGIHTKDIKEVYMNKGNIVIETDLSSSYNRISDENKYTIIVLMTKQESYEAEGLILD